jgi:shikimate kinase
MTIFTSDTSNEERIEILCQAINRLLKPTESIILVGMMGAGKTTIGRRLSTLLNKPFIDTDIEIEEASQMSVTEIFERYGEAHFRELERRLIVRLLKENHGIVAIGGGAFMDEVLRDSIHQSGISIWLKADLQTLVGRVHKKGHRPLLKSGDTEIILKNLIEKRYPIYQLSDIIVNNSEDVPENIDITMLERLLCYLRSRKT